MTTFIVVNAIGEIIKNKNYNNRNEIQQFNNNTEANKIAKYNTMSGIGHSVYQLVSQFDCERTVVEIKVPE